MPKVHNPPIRNNASKSGAQSKSIEISQITHHFFPQFETRFHSSRIERESSSATLRASHVNAKLTRLIAATWISFRAAKREENRALIEFRFGADNGVDTRDKTPPTLPLCERTNEPEEGAKKLEGKYYRRARNILSFHWLRGQIEMIINKLENESGRRIEEIFIEIIIYKSHQDSKIPQTNFVRISRNCIIRNIQSTDKIAQV